MRGIWPTSGFAHLFLFGNAVCVWYGLVPCRNESAAQWRGRQPEKRGVASFSRKHKARFEASGSAPRMGKAAKVRAKNSTRAVPKQFHGRGAPEMGCAGAGENRRSATLGTQRSCARAGLLTTAMCPRTAISMTGKFLEGTLLSTHANHSRAAGGGGHVAGLAH